MQMSNTVNFNLEIGTFSNYITDKSIFECQRHIC